jgi:peroxiredoxin Q/BCP
MMSELAVGDVAPDFELEGDGGNKVSLSALKEAIAFTEQADAFAKLGVTIIGLSPDTAAKHDKFIAKHNLAIRLGADTEKEAAEAYGVWVEKSMYGKTYMGVERSTFLVGPDGKIAQIWRKVKVPGHADAVLEAARAL